MKGSTASRLNSVKLSSRSTNIQTNTILHSATQSKSFKNCFTSPDKENDSSNSQAQLSGSKVKSPKSKIKRKLFSGETKDVVSSMLDHFTSDTKQKSDQQISQNNSFRNLHEPEQND